MESRAGFGNGNANSGKLVTFGLINRNPTTHVELPHHERKGKRRGHCSSLCRVVKPSQQRLAEYLDHWLEVADSHAQDGQL